MSRERKKMDKHRIMMKEELEFHGMIREFLKIPIKNPNLIFIFLACFLLIIFLFIKEIFLQQTIIHTAKIWVHHPLCVESRITYGDFTSIICNTNWTPFDGIRNMIENFSLIYLSSTLVFLGIIHLLDLVIIIIIVHTASAIYLGENNDPTYIVKEILCSPIKKVGFKGPLITSLYNLLLSSLILIGFLSLTINSFVTTSAFFMVLLVVLYLALLTKYVEWSAIWKMGVVISISEEKHGDVAIGVAAYISRGNRKRGSLVILMFLFLTIALRLLRLDVGWHDGGNEHMMIISVVMAAGLKVCIDCLANLVKWVAFMIYYYDCKKRFLGKKFDGTEERPTDETIV